MDLLATFRDLAATFQRASLGHLEQIGAPVIGCRQGVTKFLYKRFYPEAILDPRKYDEPTRQRRCKKNVRKRVYTHSLIGKRAGSQVHKQLERFFNESISPAHPRYSTILFMKQLLDMNLQPVRSEVPVGWRASGFFTMIDLVCLDARGRLVAIEFKTGRETEYYKATPADPYLRIPGFERFQDCPWTRDQLQLLATKAIVQQGRSDVTPIARYIVLKSDERLDAVGVFPLTNTMRLSDMTKQLLDN